MRVVVEMMAADSVQCLSLILVFSRTRLAGEMGGCDRAASGAGSAANRASDVGEGRDES